MVQDQDGREYEAYQSASGHHVMLATTRHPQAPNTHFRTEDDMVNIGTFAARFARPVR